jgi:hypothetical protein
MLLGLFVFHVVSVVVCLTKPRACLHRPHGEAAQAAGEDGAGVQMAAHKLIRLSHLRIPFACIRVL